MIGFTCDKFHPSSILTRNRVDDGLTKFGCILLVLRISSATNQCSPARTVSIAALNAKKLL